VNENCKTKLNVSMEPIKEAEKQVEANLPEEKVCSVTTRVFHREGPGVERSQWLIKEQPVTLYLNGREIVTLLCAGHHLDELAVGFFCAEGFLEKAADLESLEVNEAEGKVNLRIRSDVLLTERLWQKRTVTSGCGKGSLFYYSLDALLSRPITDSAMRVSANAVVDRVEDLNRLSDTYRRTHGVHNSAVADGNRIVLFRDDIGRHNAVDMIVGHFFLNDLSLEDKLLITTGRLTSEILIKVAKVRIPILISRNTATSLAVELARSLNITLIGYARGGRFTVYSGEERIM
jgi:FdhD protein